jgi:hypothetical protein
MQLESGQVATMGERAAASYSTNPDCLRLHCSVPLRDRGMHLSSDIGLILATNPVRVDSHSHGGGWEEKGGFG